MRGDVAFFGTFGYELNLLKLPNEAKECLKEQIACFKSHRTLIHSGDFYRLLSPFEGTGNQTAWMVVSKDGKEAIVGFYQVLARPNDATITLRLQGLECTRTYRVSGFEKLLLGGYLMQFGLIIKPSYNGIESTGDAVGDYQSRVWTVTRLE